MQPIATSSCHTSHHVSKRTSTRERLCTAGDKARMGGHERADQGKKDLLLETKQNDQKIRWVVFEGVLLERNNGIMALWDSDKNGMDWVMDGWMPFRLLWPAVLKTASEGASLAGDDHKRQRSLGKVSSNIGLFCQKMPSMISWCFLIGTRSRWFTTQKKVAAEMANRWVLQ